MDNFDKYLGKIFELGGRGPDAYDCYGLVMAICKENGFELPELDTPESVKMRKQIFDNRIKGDYLELLDGPEPGALAVFDYRAGGLHIGVIDGSGRRFIHISSTTKTSKIHHLNDEYYLRFVYGYYRPTNKIQRASETA